MRRINSAILNSDFSCTSEIKEAFILIAIDPKALHVVIHTDKYLFAINKQTSDTDTVVWCALKLEYIGCLVDLIKFETLFKYIEPSYNLFSIIIHGI